MKEGSVSSSVVALGIDVLTCSDETAVKVVAEESESRAVAHSSARRVLEGRLSLVVARVSLVSEPRREARSVHVTGVRI